MPGTGKSVLDIIESYGVANTLYFHEDKIRYVLAGELVDQRQFYLERDELITVFKDLYETMRIEVKTIEENSE